jgi:hypothetical protein
MNVLAAIPSRANHEMLEVLLEDLRSWNIDTVVYDHGYTSREGKNVLRKHRSVVNAHGWPFYEMWNDAWNTGYRLGFDAVAMLNDDVFLHKDSIATALDHITEDIGIVGFNYRRTVMEGCDPSLGINMVSGTYKDGGVWGCGFLVNTSTWGVVPPIDKRYHIWYGDDELFLQMQNHGYEVGIALGAAMEHRPSTTVNQFPELLARTGEDYELFTSKFG